MMHMRAITSKMNTMADFSPTAITTRIRQSFLRTSTRFSPCLHSLRRRYNRCISCLNSNNRCSSYSHSNNSCCSLPHNNRCCSLPHNSNNRCGSYSHSNNSCCSLPHNSNKCCSLPHNSNKCSSYLYSRHNNSSSSKDTKTLSAWQIFKKPAHPSTAPSVASET